MGESSDPLWLHVAVVEGEFAGTVIVMVSFSGDVDAEHDALL